ncbi:MAG: usg protein [Alphaproteobacteria bacterium]
MALQLEGWRMTTAEIIYHMPDQPGILQSFVWQNLDYPPEFPKLHKFLDFWTENLDGPLHSVRVGHTGIITPPKFRNVEKSFDLH